MRFHPAVSSIWAPTPVSLSLFSLAGTDPAGSSFNEVQYNMSYFLICLHGERKRTPDEKYQDCGFTSSSYEDDL